MSKQPDDKHSNAPISFEAWKEHLDRIAEESEDLIESFASRRREGAKAVNNLKQDTFAMLDPANIREAFSDLFRSLMINPQDMINAQVNLWRAHMDLWQATAQRLKGEEVDPVIEPGRRDRRFRHPDWQENLVFDYIKQSYLLTSKWLQETVDQAEGLTEEEKRKVSFYTQQYVDAISPSNFVMTNPEVLKATLESNGDNLVRGLKNLLHDLEQGDGKLVITQTDMDHFKIGENIATTPGKVVYQNDVIQLLQYTPTTEKVYSTPLLIFPPWINKFYILDLREDNSFIKWMVDKGYTVFVVSWVNPDAKLAEKTMTDYMEEGIFEAIEAVQKATGAKQVNTIGYCIGGTLLGSTLAYMAQKKIDTIKSATFFTAQVDFTEAGELLVFIDEEQINNLEKEIDESGGYLDGTSMATTFNMLRSNDLIWSYVVNNYLMGKDPARFDLLYWNADATRMPKALHLQYLRDCYLNNRLAKGEMTLGDIKVDLTKVKIPIFLQSGKEDHIAPYKSVYKATHIYSGPVEFMVAGSGHIAGVVNPPSAKKYNYWTNKDVGTDLDDWWSGAQEHPGSWWPYWEKWLRAKSGKKTDARAPGDGLSIIEDAPGSYVKVR
ncbi:MAG: class I poly(R)-hydroxyalkanoic acid synthase [Alphaproteobacteria bacterium]|nr:MAG: class I poly(R)-hydroxyalkanoic acid synthase [Alphaproteobacteria bacterium]